MLSCQKRGEGVDAVALSHWLLRFGKESYSLWEAVAKFTRWIENFTPPWTAKATLIANRFMALDKCPGVHLIDIGKIWCSLFMGCVLKVTGAKATEACSMDQLYTGLKVDIEWGSSCG